MRRVGGLGGSAIMVGANDRAWHWARANSSLEMVVIFWLRRCLAGSCWCCRERARSRRAVSSRNAGSRPSADDDARAPRSPGGGINTTLSFSPLCCTTSTRSYAHFFPSFRSGRLCRPQSSLFRETFPGNSVAACGFSLSSTSTPWGSSPTALARAADWAMSW